MSAGVSRGLLSTEAGLSRAIVTSKLAPAAVADKAISLLQREPVGGFHWRAKCEWAAGLASGGPDDRGRRLFTEAGRTDARYVAHLARLAFRGGRETDGWGRPTPGAAWGRTLPTPAQFHRLRAAIERIYDELGGRIG